MKKLTCEMCGSTNLVKQDGMFVCQDCGTKYSIEEAKKMMIEGTVEVAGTVKIDRSDNYNNLVQLARDAIADGRFDSAYSNCSEALAIMPNDPEMIALQGFAVLGKEEIITDVPSSCVNAMKRMIAVIPEYKASFDDKRNLLTELNKKLEGVVKFKTALYDEQIKNLNSQKVAYSPSEEKLAAGNLALQALGGNIFTQQKAEADLDKAKAKRLHNEELDKQISKIRDKVSKLDRFKDTFRKETSTCSQQVSKAEREYKDSVRDAYWEEHKAEKEELESKLSVLGEQRKPVLEALNVKRSELKAIESELKSAKVPSYLRREELRDQVRELERQRANLGIFKGREKKEITAKIENLNSQMPTSDTISAEEQEMRKAKQPIIDEIKGAIANLEKQDAALNSQISEAQTELTKDR